MGNYIFLIKVLTRSPNCDIMYMWGKGDNNFILDCIKNFLNRKYKKGIDNYTEMCYNIYVRLGKVLTPQILKNFLNRKYKKGIDNYTEMCYNIYVRLGVNQNPTVYKEDKKIWRK